MVGYFSGGWVLDIGVEGVGGRVGEVDVGGLVDW